MSWFATLLMAVAAGIVCANGSRAQWLVARLAGGLGKSQGLLLAALGTSCATMAFATWLGWQASVNLGEVELRALAAAALLGAAVELLWPVRILNLQEPTQSLGAMSLVLTARQLADAPRLVAFAVVTQLNFAWLVGIGGAIGVVLCLWFGWKFDEVIDRRFSATAVRATLGLILLVLGGVLAAEAVDLARLA